MDITFLWVRIKQWVFIYMIDVLLCTSYKSFQFSDCPFIIQEFQYPVITDLGRRRPNNGVSNHFNCLESGFLFRSSPVHGNYPLHDPVLTALYGWLVLPLQEFPSRSRSPINQSRIWFRSADYHHYFWMIFSTILYFSAISIIL